MKVNKVLEDGMTEKITPDKVSDYFLHKSGMTPKKIQKLVYYAYAWFIALNNEDKEHIDNKLFDESPEAWLHGPVFPSLYAKYKEYGWNEVSKNKRRVKFKDNELNIFLDKIWNVFGKYSADDLEYMTHQEFPWRNARKGLKSTDSSNNKILDRDIFVYYNELAQK